ncbi:unnamed protein product [Adineta steineri]|uniref:Uncharacterized protein n=1 Tax=Adineta steineri TaxID=433720 RepID=A0A814PR74_9BILA|nr:unnamed protein product [Adineta steineri]
MSQPVSKSFNRISDFIFPDTIHIHMSRPSLQQFDNERYGRTDHYNIPASNRPRSCYQPDLIIVERLPADELDNIDLLYHEQHYQTNRQLRRRYSSIIDDRRMPPNEKPPTEIPTRPAAFRRYLIYCDPLPNNTYVACLGIEDINASDAGKYKISAKNKLGEIEFVPSFIWTLDGKPITMGARYKQEILSEGNIHTIFLEIAQLTAKDSDAYKVTTNIQLNIEAIDFKLPEGITPSFLN